jgi:hypothetical protein
MGKLATAVNNSANRKIGDAAATYAAQVSCPDECPFLGSGCYAEDGTVAFTTRRLNRTAKEQNADAIAVANAEAKEIDKLPGGRLLRLHVVGDCKTVEAVRILRKAVERYVERSGTLCEQVLAAVNASRPNV